MEATLIVENLKPAANRTGHNQHRERWPSELEVEQEVIEPAEVKANPEAFRFIGQEVTEMLDYRQSFSDARSSVVSTSDDKNPNWLRS